MYLCKLVEWQPTAFHCKSNLPSKILSWKPELRLMICNAHCWSAFYGFSSIAQLYFDSLRSHGLQHAWLPSPSPTPRAYSNMSIESVMPSNHLILCRPLLLPPSIFPSIRVFSNESALRIRWPKYWSFSFSISPSNQDWFPLGWTGWISLLSKRLSRVFSNTTVQKRNVY